MIVKQLTEHHLEFLTAEAHIGLHLSKCHIFGNHISIIFLEQFSDNRLKENFARSNLPSPHNIFLEEFSDNKLYVGNLNI